MPEPSESNSVKRQIFTSDRTILKAKYSFYSTLVFFLIANPETYKVMQRALGSVFSIADPVGGCPTAGGFFLHTALFFLVMWGLMMFPHEG
jgi:hypothetical protein